MSNDLATGYLRRFQQMVAQRQPQEQVWREVFEYLAPERCIGWYDDQNLSGAGAAQHKRAELFDSTGIDGIEVLKSTINAGLTPANSRWFNLDAGQDDEASTAWMDGAAQWLFEQIHASNFDTATSECYSDLLPAGWFVLYIDQKRDIMGRLIGGFNFESWPLNQCYIAASRPGGKVDTVFRKYCPTIEQIVTEYGIDNVSDGVRNKYEKGTLTDTVEVIWCIEPNTKYKGGVLSKNLPFKTCHFEMQTKKVLKESGYQEFPCAVPRWRLIPGTPYATGIGSNVLPFVKTLNNIQRLELSSLDIAVCGMWKAVDDGVLNPKTVRLGPRKIVMMADIQNFQELKTGSDFNVSFAKSEELRREIRRTLMTDQLTPSGGPVRSATEINRDVMMVRQLMGPILGRQQPEFLQVVIERCFNIAFRAGALQAELGPLPDSLRDADYNIKYISPLARSQKLEEVNAIDAYAAGLIEVAANTQNPSILDNLKWDPAQYEKGLALGVPATMLRGPEELAAKRKLDQEAQQEAQEQQQASQLQQFGAEKAIESAAAA